MDVLSQGMYLCWIRIGIMKQLLTFWDIPLKSLCPMGPPSMSKSLTAHLFWAPLSRVLKCQRLEVAPIACPDGGDLHYHKSYSRGESSPSNLFIDAHFLCHYHCLIVSLYSPPLWHSRWYFQQLGIWSWSTEEAVESDVSPSGNDDSSSDYTG